MKVLHRLTAAMTGAPKKLGLKDGRLYGCPSSPNCVSTEAEGEQHGLERLSYEGDLSEVKAAVLQILHSIDNLTVELNEDDYIYATTLSPMWGFIDDVEIYFDEASKQIQMRSCARLGHEDLGANRKRLEQIQAAFKGA